jgi:hypothetical protein
MWGCETHEQTADDAFERVKEEKLLSGDPATPLEVPAPPKAANPASPRSAPLDKWSQFKQAADAKINENIATVKTIKSLPNNGKSIKTVIALEKENNELSAKIIAYEVEEKARWEKFETELNADLAAVTEKLKAMKASNPSRQ